MTDTAGITTPDRPQLRTIPDVEILKVGSWPTSAGSGDFTPDDLAAAVRAAQLPELSRPVIKLGHVDPRFDGEPSVGWVDDIRLSDDGSTLVGDLKGLPSWLADVMPSAYPNRSIEAMRGWVDSAGHTHDLALTGLALLGVTPPAVGTLSSLRDVAALYDVAAGRDGPEEGIRIMPTAAPITASASVEDVRRSFYEDGPGKNTWWWLEELFIDPSEVIAMDDDNAELKKIPFSIGSDDSITWGDAETVKREYVAASKTTPAAQWDDATTSRGTDYAVAASKTDTEGGSTVMELTDEQVTTLRTNLDLADDATVEDIIAATQAPAAPAESAEQIQASASKLGFRVVEAAAFDANQKQLDRLLARDRERIVDTAVAAGKLMPSSRASALSQLEKGLLTEDDIDQLEPVVTMAGREMGHDHGQNQVKEPADIRDSEAYQNWK